jgi:dTMP kinase
MPGRFITFEGIEGVGKSTQLVRAAGYLRRSGLEVVMTREPGGTPLAETIRRLVLEPHQDTVDGVSELLLMFAARSLHLTNLIEPALARGAWVLCDRFTDATEAYQGAGRGIPLKHIRALEDIAQRGRRPDLTLLLDAPVDLATARTAQRGAPSDRFESEQGEFFQRVRDGYLAILAREPKRVVRIDATRTVEAVATDVAEALDHFANDLGRAHGPA